MTAYEKLKAARHSRRPTGGAYVRELFSDTVELHGDRRYGDDPAIIGGVGYLGDIAVTFIAIDRGADLASRIKKNFGCPKPEGCAGILWKDAGRAPDAAQALHITADDMKGYGIVEDIVTENFDDFPAMCGELGALLARDLRVLKEMTPQQLCSDRYARFRSFGIFREKT